MTSLLLRIEEISAGIHVSVNSCAQIKEDSGESLSGEYVHFRKEDVHSGAT